MTLQRLRTAGWLGLALIGSALAGAALPRAGEASFQDAPRPGDVARPDLSPKELRRVREEAENVLSPRTVPANAVPGSPRAIAEARFKAADRVRQYYLHQILAPPTRDDLDGGAIEVGPERPGMPPRRIRVPDEFRRRIESIEQLCIWAGRAVEARVELCATKAQRVAVLRDHWAGLLGLERRYEFVAQNGSSGISDVDVARIRFLRLEAEARLAKAMAE